MARIPRDLAVAAAVALLATVPAAAQVPRRPMPQNERAVLQQRVHARFMEVLTRRLQLNDQQRDQVSAILQKDMQERLELGRKALQNQHALAVATADTTTNPAQIQALLDEMDRLRGQETALAAREDSALATVLTPRQRAEFIMLRNRFNERVRQIRGGMRRPGMRGPPPAPPGPPF
ncbi:MAG: periplasmic heavy metal sensor [Gemmatimonadota bacterium]|jgi:Spy/CpxP family protein refolding chaperone